MSPQLSFQFTEALTYSSDTFVLHQGVLHIADTLVTLASEQRFAVLVVSGGRGSGKTHLGVYCAGVLQGLARPVQILRGKEVASSLQRSRSGRTAVSGESLIIDDAHEWLETKECEGVFTALADQVLQGRGILILLSEQPIERLRLTPQVNSRLTAGVQLAIGASEERHLDEVIRTMAKQRGLRLTPAKRDFILTRVPRTISALSAYFERLQEVNRNARASTSLEVLGRAAER
jgi:chromosomal replication initiation ATPase DnaA